MRDRNDLANRANRPNLPPQARPKLYYPSIFRYKCYGAYHVSSDKHFGEEGVCRGIQSRMEHLRDLNPSSRTEAVNTFCQAVEFPPAENASNEPHSHETLQALLQTQAIIYDEEIEQGKGKKKKEKHEEEESWHDWDCYGSTDVHLLVLRDVQSKRETIAGVSPDCALGVSVRDVGTKEGGDTVATMRIGPLEVSLGNSYTYEPQEQEETQTKDRNTKNSNSQRRHSHAQKNNEQDSPRKFLDVSQKIFDSMKHNAHVLKDAVSEDFPSRTLDASKRIVAQFEKTFERTVKLMGSVLGIRRGGDRDD